MLSRREAAILLFLTGNMNKEMIMRMQPNKKVSEKSKCSKRGRPFAKFTETKKPPKDSRKIPKERRLARKKR